MWASTHQETRRSDDAGHRFHEVAKAERWPKLAALRRRIEKDPAVAFATAVENGERPAGSGACVGHVSLAEVIERFGA